MIIFIYSVGIDAGTDGLEKAWTVLKNLRQTLIEILSCSFCFNSRCFIIKLRTAKLFRGERLTILSHETDNDSCVYLSYFWHVYLIFPSDCWLSEYRRVYRLPSGKCHRICSYRSYSPMVNVTKNYISVKLAGNYTSYRKATLS